MGSANKARIASDLKKSAKDHPKPKGNFKQLENKVGSEKLAGWITNQMGKGSKKRVGK